MHFYQFHIGDYRAATAHLSNEEDLAYRRLLDMYYDTEQPLTDDTEWLARRIRISQDVVVRVLHDMFEPEGNRWHHKRVEKEIANYKAMSEGGKRGAAKRWGKGSDSPPINTPMQTKNHKPRTNNQIDKPDGVSEIVWQEFVGHRKAKKAPVTALVMQSLYQEAKKAGWDLESVLKEIVFRNWQSFKADWVQARTSPVSNSQRLLDNGI